MNSVLQLKRFHRKTAYEAADCSVDMMYIPEFAEYSADMKYFPLYAEYSADMLSAPAGRTLSGSDKQSSHNSYHLTDTDSDMTVDMM